VQYGTFSKKISHLTSHFSNLNYNFGAQKQTQWI
jgi:hypothetical protein